MKCNLRFQGQRFDAETIWGKSTGEPLRGGGQRSSHPLIEALYKDKHSRYKKRNKKSPCAEADALSQFANAVEEEKGRPVTIDDLMEYTEGAEWTSLDFNGNPIAPCDLWKRSVKSGLCWIW